MRDLLNDLLKVFINAFPKTCLRFCLQFPHGILEDAPKDLLQNWLKGSHETATLANRILKLTSVVRFWVPGSPSAADNNTLRKALCDMCVCRTVLGALATRMLPIAIDCENACCGTRNGIKVSCTPFRQVLLRAQCGIHRFSNKRNSRKSYSATCQNIL